MRTATLLLFVLTVCRADTIVLKNGRRIVGESITEEADRVTYQSRAGQMSVPKSIVDHIERDDFIFSSRSSADSEPPVSAPLYRLPTRELGLHVHRA